MKQQEEYLKETAAHGTAIFPLAVYQWERDMEDEVRLHWHKETEMIFLERGRFTVNLQMNEFQAEGPLFLFVNPGEIHGLKLAPGQKESAVVFELNMLSFSGLDGVQLELIRPLLEEKRLFPPMVEKDHPAFPRILEAYREVCREAGRKTLDAYLLVKANLYRILAELYGKDAFLASGTMVQADREKAECGKKILRFIDQEYGRKITIEEAARVVSMNPQYFCRYFKRLMGKTFTEYVNGVRIEEAARLLGETQEKVIDIASACGYENIGYFIRRFKEQKGITPQEYRKRTKSQYSAIK